MLVILCVLKDLLVGMKGGGGKGVFLSPIVRKNQIVAGADSFG
jgi:hypothetical protein